MLHIGFKAAKVSYNVDAHKRAIIKKLQLDFRKALKEFIKVTIDKVPSYSGNARAVLIPLASQLGMTIPISIEDGARFAWRTVTKGKRKGQIFILRGKAPEYTKERGISEGSDFELIISDDEISLKINNESLHYRINEFNDVRSKYPEIWGKLKESLPWLSFEVGKAAYRKYMRENIKKNIPSIKKFTQVINISVE